MAKWRAAEPRSTSLSDEVRLSRPMSARNGWICAGSPVDFSGRSPQPRKVGVPLRRAERSLTWYRASLFAVLVSRTVELNVENDLKVPVSRVRAGTEDNDDDEGSIPCVMEGRVET